MTVPDTYMRYSAEVACATRDLVVSDGILVSDLRSNKWPMRSQLALVFRKHV